VTHDKDVYELTTIGKLITDKMIPLSDITDILDIDVEYWGTRNLDLIPLHLLERINELKKCTIVKPKLPEMYTLPPQIYGAFSQFQETPSKSKSFTGVSTFFYPNSYEVFLSMIRNDVKVNVIITRELFDKIRCSQHAKIAELLDNKLYNLYIYPKKMGFVSFAYDDHHLLMRLLDSKGGYDTNYVLCSSPAALEWGKDLFDYYVKDSMLITEI
jgi:predicted transcriptional regulator